MVLLYHGTLIHSASSAMLLASSTCCNSDGTSEQWCLLVHLLVIVPVDGPRERGLHTKKARHSAQEHNEDNTAQRRRRTEEDVPHIEHVTIIADMQR